MGAISEAAASSINSWSTMASIVAAIITAFTAYTAFWSNNIIKTYSDQKIATAAATAEKAREGVARAQVEIANANEGAERARADAAQARLETAKISDRLQATSLKLNAANTIRPLSDEQLNKLKISLIGYKVPPGATVFLSAPNDREAQYVATQIDHLFTKVGILRTLGEGVSDYVPTGKESGQIIVAFGSAIPRQSAQDLAARFNAAGFAATTEKLRKDPSPMIEEVAQKFISVRVVPSPKPSY